MTLQAILYKPSQPSSPPTLQILNQLQLPHVSKYQDIDTTHDAWLAIREMRVRGAPAIAIVAVLGLATELGRAIHFHDQTVATEDVNVKSNGQDMTAIKAVVGTATSAAKYITQRLTYLLTSRPTAVNLSKAVRELIALLDSTTNSDSKSISNVIQTDGARRVVDTYIQAAEQMLIDDVNNNENMGRLGTNWILTKCTGSTSWGNQGIKISVITHCNTGYVCHMKLSHDGALEDIALNVGSSLATAGYGTALGVIRSLHAIGCLNRVYYTETRPYDQGSRLTGYELLHDGIPCTLITDSMAAALLRLKGDEENIVAIIVGADRVAANGDTANKIGTYALAILARHHGIKFLVAAPRTTIDLDTSTGENIIIEERAASEVLLTKGPRASLDNDGRLKYNIETLEEISPAASGTNAWNPAFDVTPAELIDGIVTEIEVVEKNASGRFNFAHMFTQ
ncbi:S-methyl-5-thioribose-1-phosphate isomerase [Bachmanniomyces sp. S44760]|nr:S-methyl-5-thioribose-1-phosphate isomerase [Bachmanniomyces sp. S44760]